MTQGGDAEDYAERLAGVMKALSHPIRVKILALCSVREMTNRELRETLRISKPLLLSHLKELSRRGLLEHRVKMDEENLIIRKYYRTSDFHLTVSRDSLAKIGRAILRGGE